MAELALHQHGKGHVRSCDRRTRAAPSKQSDWLSQVAEASLALADRAPVPQVRLGRVWREGKTHYMVEWTVSVMLESDMAHAFQTHSNKDMTATDTQKNTVRWIDV